MIVSLRNILLAVVAAVPGMVAAQVVELPDSLFVPPMSGDIDGGGEKIFAPTVEPLFAAPPATNIGSYVESLARRETQLYMELPEGPSEFYLHVLLLHLSKVEIPGLDEELELYRIMLENFNRNLYSGGAPLPYVPDIVDDVSRASRMFGNGGGSGVAISGCLDPVEAYRRYIQQRNLERARRVIEQLENETLPTKDEMPQQMKIKLPDLMKENFLDVDVKVDGDRPPYRP